MCHDQVTEEAGEIEQHVEFVPETLSPNFSPPAVEIRHAVDNRNRPMKKRSSLAVAFFSQGDMTGIINKG